MNVHIEWLDFSLSELLWDVSFSRAVIIPCCHHPHLALFACRIVYVASVDNNSVRRWVTWLYFPTEVWKNPCPLHNPTLVGLGMPMCTCPLLLWRLFIIVYVPVLFFVTFLYLFLYNVLKYKFLVYLVYQKVSVQR